MRGIGSRVGLAALVVVAILAAGGARAPAALAKGYTIPSVGIDARVMTNGDLVVTEKRTLSFDGSFTRVYWYLDTKGSQGIEVSGVSGPDGPLTKTTPDLAASRPPGTYLVTPQGTQVFVQAFFRLSDTQATFTLQYRALGAAKRWQDTAELYWQFVGTGWGVPTGHVHVTLHLPPDVARGQVRAWAHGPLNGVVTIEPDASVSLVVDDLPAQRFVEARVLFPAAALAKVEPLPGARLQEVLDQEARLAKEANAARDREKTRDRLRTAGNVASLVISLGLVVLFFYLFFTKGREHKPTFREEYLRDLPADLPPAVVGCLWRMGSVDELDFTATLLDLIDRGVVAIADEGETGWLHKHHDYRLTVHRDKGDGLAAHEQRLITFLCDDVMGADSFTMAELRAAAKSHANEFRTGYASWQKAVTTLAGEQGFFEKEAGKAQMIVIALGATWMVLCVLGMFVGVHVGLLGIFVAGGVMAASSLLKRRTQAAADLEAKYKALKRYLHDFGRMQEKPPTSVVLWEHFLVLAVVFGIADEVVKTMQVAIPEVVQDRQFSTMRTVAFAEGGVTGSALAALTEGFAAAHSAATPSSSAGGGGGGFSGGGGGGGGGGAD